MDLDDLFALGKVIEFEGFTFTIRALEVEERGKYTRWIKANAYQELARMQESGDYSDTFVRLQSSVITQDINAGLYNWGAPVSVHSVSRTPDGMAYSLWLMAVTACPTITPLVTRRLVDTRLQEVAAALYAATTDPPASSAPAESSPPGPTAAPGSATEAATVPDGVGTKSGE